MISDKYEIFYSFRLVSSQIPNELKYTKFTLQSRATILYCQLCRIGLIILFTFSKSITVFFYLKLQETVFKNFQNVFFNAIKKEF